MQDDEPLETCPFCGREAVDVCELPPVDVCERAFDVAAEVQKVKGL